MGTSILRGRWRQRAIGAAVVLSLAIGPSAAWASTSASTDAVTEASVDAPTSLAPDPSFVSRAMVTKKGGCSGPSNWKLVLSKGSGKITVTFTVRGGPADMKWSVFMEDNGNGIFAGSRTSNNDGAFTAKKTTNDRSGTDRILAGADAKNGETCVGKGSI